MPDGSVELVINLGEDESRIYDRDNPQKFQTLPGSIVCGPHSNFFVIDTDEQASVIGIHFKPGGVFPFFDIPVNELHNLHVSLEDLWGMEARSLRERLLGAPTAQAKFILLEQMLLARACKPLEAHRAVRFALGAFSGEARVRSIAEVSNQTGMSSRRFIQLFSDEVGLTPKLFCRVRRFQKAIKLIHLVRGGKEFQWADVAAECGYFDQAHFIHDFKAISGINPSSYMALKTEHLNHVPIIE